MALGPLGQHIIALVGMAYGTGTTGGFSPEG